MTTVTVRFDWREVGWADLDARLPTGPGLYRFRLIGVSGTSSYIGEAAVAACRALFAITTEGSITGALRLRLRDDPEHARGTGRR